MWVIRRLCLTPQTTTSTRNSKATIRSWCEGIGETGRNTRPVLFNGCVKDLRSAQSCESNHRRGGWSNRSRQIMSVDDMAKDARRIEGDLPPFEELFRLHHRRVYAMCLRMT